MGKWRSGVAQRGTGGGSRNRETSTESEGRTHQNTEGDAGQGASQAQAVELPQDETEALQSEVSADARLLTEEGPGEMDIQDQEDSTRITEPSPPPIGGGSKKVEALTG